MTKKEFIQEVKEAAINNVKLSTTDIEIIIENVFDCITENLRKGNTVAWPKFGKFERVTSNPKKGRNPATGETIDIPAKNKVKFKMFSTLKEMLN